MICFNCKTELKEGAEYMSYKDVDFVKCRKCHEEDPVLRNFRETEIYSRPCGYIRPIKNFNPGKLQEFHDRVEFKASSEGHNQVS